MFASADGLSFENGVINTSFRDAPKAWPSFGPEELPVFGSAKMVIFGIGHPERGPVIQLMAMPASDMGVDYQDALRQGVVHMHRSDSFRTTIVGDLVVQPKIYGNGQIRLQQSGAYYGPEGPGPLTASGKEGTWMILSFADKRGYRIQAMDKEDLFIINKMEAWVTGKYDKVGSHPVLPEAAAGLPAIKTNLDQTPRAGHLDVTFGTSTNWPKLGDVRAAFMAIGHPVYGPVYAAFDAPAGAVAFPASQWATELVQFVVSGECTIGDRVYQTGDVRLQEAGVAHPEVRAGDQGVHLITLIGDRSTGFESHLQGRDALSSGIEAFLSQLSKTTPSVSVAQMADSLA